MRITVEKKREVLSLIPDVTYASAQSWYGATRRDLHMDLIVPKNRDGHAPCPALVWFCGGAFRVMDRAVWMPELMRFAEAGFAVASVEYRTGNEAVFPAPLIDAKAAVRFLRAHAGDFCIDPERIACAGESAGGAIACLLGVTGEDRTLDQGDWLEQSSRVGAVADYYGLADMTISLEDYEGNNDVPPWMLEEALGVRYTREQAEAASAVCRVTPLAPPHLILQGLEDAVVSPDQSRNYYKKLQENGVEAELLELEGAGHGDALFFQDEVKDRVIRFLQRSLNRGKCANREVPRALSICYSEDRKQYSEHHGEEIAYRYIHGGFQQKGVKFSLHFPKRDAFRGRFFQYLSPFPGPDEEMASLAKTGGDDVISFSLQNGAYFVESNMGSKVMFGPNGDDRDRWKSSAAVAEFSRKKAMEIYACPRPVGIVYGGSGGGYKTMACIENIDAWDGAVPYVIGSPVSLPNTITMHVQGERVLRRAFPKILDALDAGDRFGITLVQSVCCVYPATTFSFNSSANFLTAASVSPLKSTISDSGLFFWSFFSAVVLACSFLPSFFSSASLLMICIYSAFLSPALQQNLFCRMYACYTALQMHLVNCIGK